MSRDDKVFLKKAIWAMAGVVTFLSGVIGTLYGVDRNNSADLIERLEVSVEELAEAEKECRTDREDLRDDFVELRLKFAEMHGVIAGKKMAYQKATADGVNDDSQ